MQIVQAFNGLSYLKAKKKNEEDALAERKKRALMQL
jgi:hypothetical protein